MDIPKYLTVKVTKAHIKRAQQGQTNTCAIALALTEQLGLDKQEVKANRHARLEDVDGDYVSVSHGQIQVAKRNGFSFRLRWKLGIMPKSVMKFIRIFDNDKSKAKPFSFKLPLFK